MLSVYVIDFVAIIHFYFDFKVLYVLPTAPHEICWIAYIHFMPVERCKFCCHRLEVAQISYMCRCVDKRRYHIVLDSALILALLVLALLLSADLLAFLFDLW